MDERPLEHDVGAMAFVQASQLCSKLPGACLSRIFRDGRVLELAPGTTVVREGDTDADLYMIVDGSVAIYKGLAGEVVPLATLVRQGVFGETSALTGQPRTATVVTEVDAILIRIPADTVRAVADQEPRFGRRLAGLMAGRTRDTEVKTSGGPPAG
jgi:CRP-like cAMP-binding protein